MLPSITFHPFTSNDLNAIADHQAQYAKAFPGAPVVPGEAYLSPAFEGGNLLRCAWDGNGRLLAYAVYYPQDRLAWVEVRVLPGLEEPDITRDALFTWLVEMAKKRGQNELAFQYLPQETGSISYANNKGATFQYCIFSMQRPLDAPILECTVPPGFTLRHLRLLDKARQRQYIEARNECFPDAPVTLEEWQYFCGSPWWTDGVCIAGFSGEILAGGVTVYWEPGSTHGATEFIFTRSPYRGKGLARALVTDALLYLGSHGLQFARLEVKAENETALGLYQGLGYHVFQESRVYQLTL